MHDKIENIERFQKLKKDVQAFESLLQAFSSLSRFFPLDTKKLDELRAELATKKDELNKFSKASDQFNAHFSKLGWVAHESINSDLMDMAIALADNNQIDEAERLLEEFFSSEQIKWLLESLRAFPEFRERMTLLRAAYEDTLSKRYYSAVPILLMMMDGVVSDIGQHTGFFADNTDVTAWDSVAAHSTGLAELKRIFSVSRKGLTTEPIRLPYRNGILHGRDLGYANRTVVAKCWAALFCIGDWAQAIKEQAKKSHAKKADENDWAHLFEQLEKNELTRKKLDQWSPRELTIGVNIPEFAPSESYQSYTPEKEVMVFAENWQKHNYGAMSSQIHRYSKWEKSEKKEIGRIRRLFEGKELISYKLLLIKDESPAISEISLFAEIEVNSQRILKNLQFRCLYEDTNGKAMINGDIGGSWKFIEKFFNELQLIP